MTRAPAVPQRRYSKMRKHLVIAALVGLALRLFFVWRFPADAGDSALYQELARNWLDHGVYGVLLGGQLTPVDLRAPGYPAFLAIAFALFGRTRTAVLLAQAVLDVATCFLTAALAARLAPESARRRTAVAALWLAATCPFLANYTAVTLTETLATFLTTAALLPLVKAAQGDVAGTGTGRPGSRPGAWLLGGVFIGLGALVRPETPLLLAATGLVLLVRWRRPADWPKLVRAGALMAAGLALALLPWAARNWHTLRRVQFLTPRYSTLPAETVPRGFYAWTKTWLVRFGDVYRVPWKLDTEPIRIEELPASAFDTPEERARVAALLEEYNTTLSLSAEQDLAFARLARERTARHPLRTYFWVPLGRVATLWLTPRIEFLPFTGHLWPPGGKWEDDPVDFSVTAGFGLLNLLYVGLALAGVCLAFLPGREKGFRAHPGLAILVAFVVVRTAFFTHVETPEPRYVLECFPALLALAALVRAKSQPV